MRFILRPIGFLLGIVSVGWRYLGGQKAWVGGVRIVDSSVGTAATAQRLARLEAALLIIRTHAPRRFRALSASLRAVTIGPLAFRGAAMYPQLRIAVMDTEFVEHQPPMTIAVYLVHETVHAQLWQRGIRSPQRWGDRVERRCLLEQLDFAEHAPGAEYLAAWTRELLAAGAWKNSERIKRDAELANLRELGLSMRLVRAVERWFMP